MTIVGLDDTDSRTAGMCTTYVAARIAARLRDHGRVDRLLLVRLNPAVEHKTRGNAALAIHTTVDPDRTFELAWEQLESLAIGDEAATNPGLVVADHPVDPGSAGPAADGGRDEGAAAGAGDAEAIPDAATSQIPDTVASPIPDAVTAAIPDAVADFTTTAVRDHLTIAEAESLIEDVGYRSAHAGNGRGRIGALAAVGAPAALDEWTYERIDYREESRWGTQRRVDPDSVFAAAEAAYPAVWDTVDRGADELVCVPRTPGPVLVGIRGDDPDAVDRVAAGIDGEPVAASERFVTNQGTDVHLRDGTLGELAAGRAYRVDGIVAGDPETRRGGHVFVPIADEDGSVERECVAFEPTKRFRDRVRALRPGDRVTVCGELARGTLKLEKFAVRELVDHELATPTCPDCGRTMESAGRDQGYRCRDCGTTAAGRERRPLERSLEPGWYEVPPRARRHVAKPLIRGGFDGPTHPER